MGVIISLLLAGFAQDNLGALMAEPEITYSVHGQTGFGGSIRIVLLKRSPYTGYEVFAQPQVGARVGMFSFSLGFLTSPFLRGGVTGIPVSADAAADIGLADNLSVRPRLSLLGPAFFYAGDPSNAYDLTITAGAGVDLIYTPFDRGKWTPVLSIGGTAAYAVGELVNDLANHREPLAGFGGAGNAALGIAYSPGSWCLGFEAGVSYGGKLIPEGGITFLW